MTQIMRMMTTAARISLVPAFLLVVAGSTHLHGQERSAAFTDADRQARGLYFQALDAYYAGRLTEAFALVGRVEETLGSTNARSSALKARVLYGLERHREAFAALEEYYRAAVQSDPERGELQPLRGALAAIDAERIREENEEDDKLFRQAAAMNTVRALFEYMRQNPQGRNVPEARRRVNEEASRIARAFDGSPGLSPIRQYLSDFGSGPDYQRLVDYLVSTARQAAKDGNLKLLEEAADIALAYRPRSVDQSEALDWLRQATSRVEVVRVQGGTFKMGLGPIVYPSITYDDRRSVTLGSFLMSRTEITQAQYQTVIGRNPSSFRQGNDAARRPVESVTWFDAVAFCNALSLRHGLRAVYNIDGTNVTADWNANGYRLPTEAEWEYAASGGQKSQGLSFPGSREANSVAWTRYNSDGTTHPVGRKPANELGLHDMAGNVMEWVWDWYAPYPTTNQRNPKGPSTGPGRIVRGGSFNQIGTVTVFRGHIQPSRKGNNLGFRIVRRAD